LSKRNLDRIKAGVSCSNIELPTQVNCVSSNNTTRAPFEPPSKISPKVSGQHLESTVLPSAAREITSPILDSHESENSHGSNLNDQPELDDKAEVQKENFKECAANSFLQDSPEPQEEYLVCPFWRHDPLLYRKCFKGAWPTVARLK
jgi:hypothetical protein